MPAIEWLADTGDHLGRPFRSPPPIFLGLTFDRWRFRVFDLHPGPFLNLWMAGFMTRDSASQKRDFWCQVSLLLEWHRNYRTGKKIESGPLW